MTTMNMVPEFASEDGTGKQEVTEQPVEQPTEEVAEEKETPTEPPADSEESSEEQPAQESRETQESQETQGDDTELEKEVSGLRNERSKLIQEIRDLRGQKRESKKEELVQVDKKIDELKDVNPQDVQLIEKVLRSKGYVTREEAEQASYKATQDQKLNEFLSEFPEYKAENDKDDLNWSSLQRALQIYAKPKDPNEWGRILRRAHKDIAPESGDRKLEAKKQTVKTAGVGASSAQKSSPKNSLSPEKRVMLLQGGFSEEDIAAMEEKL